MSQMHPNSGRILTNQLSVLLGLPVSVLLLKGLPWPLLAGDVSLQWTYSCVLVLFGLVASWYVVAYFVTLHCTLVASGVAATTRQCLRISCQSTCAARFTRLTERLRVQLARVACPL